MKFHEKPDRKTAETFLKAGNFYWNAGIFVFRAQVMRDALMKYAPQVWDLAAEIKSDKSNLSEVYLKFQSISIDYAVMEKLHQSELSCVPTDVGWSDVGSWDAVAELKGSESSSKSISIKGRNNFSHSYNSQKVVSFVGVEDLIAVDTEDALLIVKKGESQFVKDVVSKLEGEKSVLAQAHAFEFRPWGKFEVLRDEQEFKSKIITVNPGQRLSLQSHAKREEHWIVTCGSGIVVLDSKEIPVKKGSYVHIPLGSKHRIFNPSTQVLRFVEVQLGDYFGEDDIVRYQDDYARTTK
jgi:mannose-1-phosphate guanylyltransferase/mannose-1-phosphate guanylyltransferase/mannose-6-phosphate isomerase